MRVKANSMKDWTEVRDVDTGILLGWADPSFLSNPRPFLNLVYSNPLRGRFYDNEDDCIASSVPRWPTIRLEKETLTWSPHGREWSYIPVWKCKRSDWEFLIENDYGGVMK